MYVRKHVTVRLLDLTFNHTNIAFAKWNSTVEIPPVQTEYFLIISHHCRLSTTRPIFVIQKIQRDDRSSVLVLAWMTKVWLRSYDGYSIEQKAGVHPPVVDVSVRPEHFCDLLQPPISTRRASVRVKCWCFEVWPLHVRWPRWMLVMLVHWGRNRGDGGGCKVGAELRARGSMSVTYLLLIVRDWLVSDRATCSLLIAGWLWRRRSWGSVGYWWW